MQPRQRWAWSWRAPGHRRSRLKRQLVGVSSTICIVEVPRIQLADRAERVKASLSPMPCAQKAWSSLYCSAGHLGVTSW